MEIKNEIRNRILDRRNALSLEEMNEKSAAIFERLCTLRQYEHAKIVLAYMDYRNEVMTRGFIKRCGRDGKRVALPKVECRNDFKALSDGDKQVFVLTNTLAVYEINEVEADTLPGFKGILEPKSAVLNRLDPTEIDLAVIPGVAFDYRRHRVGYGAGYYDRFLLKLRSDCVNVGVAYSLQLVERIPAGKHDLPMDIVVTEDKCV